MACGKLLDTTGFGPVEDCSRLYFRHCGYSCPLIQQFRPDIYQSLTEISCDGVKSWAFPRLLSCVTDTPRRAPRKFMLWLKSVIGTALWCWWQVPARRSNGASGRFELDWRLGRLGSSLVF